MRIVKIKENDISNGIGIRVSIFFSGCRHKCRGCFNSEIWDFNKGDIFNDKHRDTIFKYLEKDYIKGITILGGEPFANENIYTTYLILKEVKEKFPNKDIWIYTGFYYEYINNIMINKFKYLKEILYMCDVLVDGRFEISLLDLKLKFRGSKNQRVIDMKKTLKENTVIWYLEKKDGIDKYEKPIEYIDKNLDEMIRNTKNIL